MASTLNSNSFLLTTTPNTRLVNKNPRLRVYAKRAGPVLPPLRLGKQPSPDSPPKDGKADDSSTSKPFSFDFGSFKNVTSLVPSVTSPSSPGVSLGTRRKDPGTVFVAGATGQAGVRLVQTLLRQGFNVRAGVPELDAAQELARLAVKYKLISIQESKRLNAVESTFKDAESIAKAIGNASKVVVTIGPGENGPTTEVTNSDALQVIKAAQLAGVGHLTIIYNSSSENASTYNVLDGLSSFFSNLFSQSQPLTVAELLQKVVETDVKYTFIKTSLSDDFSPESSYNITVAAEGSSGVNDSKVASTQIATLVANVFSNTAVAENKVVEVFTAPSAPSKPVDQLFREIPEDGRRKAYAEMQAKAKAEEEANRAEEAQKKLREESKRLARKESKAGIKEEKQEEEDESSGPSVEALFTKAKDLNLGISWAKLSAQLATTVKRPSDTEQPSPKVQLATVRGQAKARTLPSKKAVVKEPAFKLPSLKPKEKPKPNAKEEGKAKQKVKEEGKGEVRKMFGGLFAQETIYIDDD